MNFSFWEGLFAGANLFFEQCKSTTTGWMVGHAVPFGQDEDDDDEHMLELLMDPWVQHRKRL